MKPTISVIIPAYNEAKYLPTTLKSLSRQTFSDFEIIVVDNNSTDATAEIAAKFGASLVRETTSGVCAARQAGLAAARGNIVVSTDADTTAYPRDWLSRIAQTMQNPRVSVVAGPVGFSDGPIWGRLYGPIVFGLVGLYYRLTGKVVYASACNLAYRRSQFSGYNSNLAQGGDEFYVLRQLKTQGQAVFLKDNVVRTSGRRLSKGFLYSFLVTQVGYYFIDYALSHFIGRSLLGTYPAIRGDDNQRASWPWRIATATLVLGTMAFFAYNHPSMAHAVARRFNYHWRRPALHLPRDNSNQLDLI